MPPFPARCINYRVLKVWRYRGVASLKFNVSTCGLGWMHAKKEHIQTEKTQMSRRKTRRLIRVCDVCQDVMVDYRNCLWSGPHSLCVYWWQITKGCLWGVDTCTNIITNSVKIGFVCFVCFDSLRPSQQSFSYVWTSFPWLNQYLHVGRINVFCSRTQRSEAGEARTRGP